MFPKSLPWKENQVTEKENFHSFMKGQCILSKRVSEIHSSPTSMNNKKNNKRDFKTVFFSTEKRQGQPNDVNIAKTRISVYNSGLSE